MNAAEVLDAVRRKYPRSALVPEVVIDSRDHGAWETYYNAVGAGDIHATRPASFRRIDALMFDGPQRTAIEVKVSRADVKRENWRKVAPWLEVTHRYIYAVPAGLIETGEVPHPQAGIWWVHDDGRVEVRRKAQVRKYPEPLPQQVITALAYRAAGVPIIEQETVL